MKNLLVVIALIALLALVSACSKNEQKENKVTLDDIAAEYVKLTLLVGQHHSSYIDAYYGPEEWQPKGASTPLAELAEQSKALEKRLENIEPPTPLKQRHELLLIQLKSVTAFIALQQNIPMTFDEESLALYDAKSPCITFAQLDEILAELDKLIPGDTPLNQRVNEFNGQFVIPKDKLDTVFVAAIDEARARTKQHIDLPSNESFSIEYVTDKIWSGYNWYKGNNYSLIQLNTDFPMYINRAIDLASHEGYPGHHVFNSQMEQHLVNNNQWIEYSVYPLFSPMSLLAEGSANYGISVAFPHEERMAFEKEVLFPLAGLDSTKVEQYYQVQFELERLSYADNVIAKQYLDGAVSKEEAIELLMKYALSSEEKSKQRIGFIEANRAYVINYNLGQDIVKAYVEQLVGTDAKNKWKVFSELLAMPKTASMMVQ